LGNSYLYCGGFKVAETRLNLELEVLEIFNHIDNGDNFLLSGGAGSGKTYSLVQVIRQVITENPTASIACMTYTNAAVREISDRFNNKNLRVSTIHEFLWDNIKSFQNELKTTLIELINDENIEKFKIPDDIVTTNYFADKEIQYKEYLLLREGIISHDELLILANYMFKKYPKLCDILKDKFQFILIDEYQDTNELVIEIFLKYLMQSKRKNIIGFFGDAMQSIYDDGVGNLNDYVSAVEVKEVKKEQNRRNPRLVYELANNLRTDGIKQTHSNDSSAPNMKDGKVKDGNIKFYYSQSAEKLDKLKEKLGWDFDNAKETKILNLTHNLIAPKAGFKMLMDIYDKDRILDYKKRITGYIKNNKITDDFSTLTFGKVIEKLPVNPTPVMQRFIDEHQELYKTAKNYPFEEFKKIYLDKDALLDDKKDDSEDESKTGSKRDNLIKHLFKIQTNINLYTEKRYNEFLRKTEYKINSISDKKQLEKIVNHLCEMTNNTISEVIKYAHEQGICKKDDKLSEFIKKKKYVYDRVIQLPFQEFQNLFSYLEGHTPFSTQHKIKGTQFNNVLVIMDNGGWNNYNFQYLFEESGSESVLERTQKLFYVCCTRSKKNLVIYYHEPPQTVLTKARSWFGDNVEII